MAGPTKGSSSLTATTAPIRRKSCQRMLRILLVAIPETRTVTNEFLELPGQPRSRLVCTVERGPVGGAETIGWQFATDLGERAHEPREIRGAPRRGCPQATTIEINDRNALGGVDQDVVRRQIRVIHAVVVELPDASPDRAPRRNGHRRALEQRRYGPRTRNALGNQVAGIDEAGAHHARRDRPRHRKSEPA